MLGGHQRAGFGHDGAEFLARQRGFVIFAHPHPKQVECADDHPVGQPDEGVQQGFENCQQPAGRQRDFFRMGGTHDLGADFAKENDCDGDHGGGQQDHRVVVAEVGD